MKFNFITQRVWVGNQLKLFLIDIFRIFSLQLPGFASLESRKSSLEQKSFHHREWKGDERDHHQTHTLNLRETSQKKQQHDGVRKSPAIMELFPTFTLARAKNQLKVFKSRKLSVLFFFFLEGNEISHHFTHHPTMAMMMMTMMEMVFHSRMGKFYRDVETFVLRFFLC